MGSQPKRIIASVFAVTCCTALFVASLFKGSQQTTWDIFANPSSALFIKPGIMTHDGVTNVSLNNSRPNVKVSNSLLWVADDTRIQEVSKPGVKVHESETQGVRSNTPRGGTNGEVHKTNSLRQESTFPVEEDYLSALRKTVTSLSLPWWERENLSDCSPLIQNNSGNGNKSIINQVTQNLKQFYNFTLRGHCGIRASLQGSRQNIVSYSLYGSAEGYWRGLPEILENIKKLYPGWLVRLHTDPRERFDFLCPLRRQHPHLFICDVRNLPPPLGNVSNLDPMLWRSSPFGDEQVERFNVRDTDSQVTSREAAAVAEWVKEGKLMHMMRDHPFHTVPVMGGMFGIYQPPNLIADYERVRRKLFHPSKVNDQINLARVLPYRLFKNSVQHSSFNCIWFRGSRAFPTRREGTDYIGRPAYREEFNSTGLDKPCPRSCRPPDHKDWEYC